MAAFGNVITLPKAANFYNGGLWGNFLSAVESNFKFCLRVRLKRLNDRGIFEFDRAKRKNNIAENSVALGYDMHNRSVLCWCDINEGRVLVVCRCDIMAGRLLVRYQGRSYAGRAVAISM